MNCTATDPSPTPEATLLMEPWRTSPTANMPGILVSNKNRPRPRRPPLGPLPAMHKVGASQQKAAIVPFGNVCQPIGPRQCSDENKHRACGYALRLAGIGAKHRNLLQMGFAVCLGHPGMGPQLNVRSFFDLVDQVLRHGAGERFAAHKNNDTICVPGEV